MTLLRRIAGQLTPVKVLIIAVVLCCVMTAATLSAAVLQFDSYKDRQAQTEQVARQQGEQNGRKLCLSLGRLAALTPPAGNPGQNPARGYDQQLHDILAELGPDIGCPTGSGR